MSNIKLVNGGMAPGGGFSGQRVRDLGELQRPTFGWRVRQAWKARHELPMRAAQALSGMVRGTLQFEQKMSGQVYRIDWTTLAPWQAQTLRELLRANHDIFDIARHFGGTVTDYGVLSRRMVTDVGVQFIVDAFANGTELENMKYHGLGTGGAAEAVGNTALTTEITANHYTGSARPTGTTEEGASANIFKTVGTHTQATAGDTITEHGVFSAVTVGVLLDRHLFTGVPLAIGDSFVTTYQLTLSSGG